MHYFYANLNRSLPPIRTRKGAPGRKWNEKYFSPALTKRLIKLFNDLQPFNIDLLFINNVPLIDLNSPLRSFNTVSRILHEEAAKPDDCELIWLMFTKEIMNLRITQTIAVRKFQAHTTKNLFINCCAKVLKPASIFEPDKIRKQLQQGYKFLTNWLNTIASHKVLKSWGILPKFQTWQEVEIPPELIIKTGMYGKRLPFPGELIENPAHELSLKLAWLLISCRQPKTRISSDGRWLYLPYFSKYMIKALQDNPIPGINLPLIKTL